jgi:circadian clock protein KaiB
MENAMTETEKSTTESFEEAIRQSNEGNYVLRLFVAGMSTKSIQAIENIKRICEEYLPGRYQLEVVDIYQQPLFAKDGQIIAAPTLVKELPPPLRKLIGSFSNEEKVLVGMDLRSKELKK